MRRPRAPWLMIVVLGSALLVLAACGGDGEPETAPAAEDPWAGTETVSAPGDFREQWRGGNPLQPPAEGTPEPKGTPAEQLAHRILNPDDNELGDARYGEAALPAAPILRDHLLEDDGDGYALAAHALASIGPKGVPFLIEALASPNEDALVEVAAALKTLGPEALPALDGLLKLLARKRDEERETGGAEMRTAAALAIGAMGPEAARAAEALRGYAASDVLDWVRASTLQALLVVAPDDEATLALLEDRAQNDDEDWLRLEALLGLARLCKDDARVIRVARAAAPHSALVADGAATVLVERGVDDARIIESYADRVQLRGPPKTTLAAAEALVKTGPNGRKAAIPLLIHTLDWARNDEHKLRAAELLGKTAAAGRADPHVQEALEVHADADHEPAGIVAACRAALKALGFSIK